MNIETAYLSTIRKLPKSSLITFKSEAIFHCLICAEDLDEEHEDWHRGRLIFDGLLFFVTEMLDETYSYNEDSLDISSDGSVFEVEYKWPIFPTDLPKSAFIHFFYVNNWNKCLFISATDARFEWD